MRKLASIQQVDALHPIEGKDRIVLAIIKGWQVIVQKGEYAVGDKTIFVETDSLLPERPEFEFLRSKKFRIKTMKMGGVLSQGICFPLRLLPERNKPYELDEDVTELMGIKKYEPDEDGSLIKNEPQKNNWVKSFFLRHRFLRPLGKILFLPSNKEYKGFPKFVDKTDETRIQNMPHILTNKKITYVGREKIDGQSGTFFLKRIKHHVPFVKDAFEFGVCSRNLRLFTPDSSS